MKRAMRENLTQGEMIRQLADGEFHPDKPGQVLTTALALLSLVKN